MKLCKKTDNPYALNNLCVYKESIQVSIITVGLHYVSLMNEYILNITNNEIIKQKDKMYYLFSLKKGFFVLSHIFSILFYYTKNLDVTVHHTNKAIYYYIEFMEQITNNEFLKLSCKDAIMYVYKKTIFELNNDYKKHMKEPIDVDLKSFDILELYIKIYKNIFIYCIDDHKMLYFTKTIMEKIMNSNVDLNSVYLYLSKLSRYTDKNKFFTDLQAYVS